MAKSLDECNREISRWTEKLREATKELDWWQKELRVAVEEARRENKK